MVVIVQVMGILYEIMTESGGWCRRSGRHCSLLAQKRNDRSILVHYVFSYIILFY